MRATAPGVTAVAILVVFLLFNFIFVMEGRGEILKFFVFFSSSALFDRRRSSVLFVDAVLGSKGRVAISFKRWTPCSDEDKSSL